MASGPASLGHLRASHADREQVIDVLETAFVQGRLTKGEFDARVGHAFASRTYADLAVVTADLPSWLAGVSRRGSPPGQRLSPRTGRTSIRQS
jgi:Domain of unknown function (DUF1707)